MSVVDVSGNELEIFLVRTSDRERAFFSAGGKFGLCGMGKSAPQFFNEIHFPPRLPSVESQMITLSISRSFTQRAQF